MKFSDITGHAPQIERLRQMVDAERIPHALLLHGPSGVGKMAVARALVQYVNCTARRNGDSCGECPACRQTAKLNNPDVHFIYPVLKNSAHPRGLSEEYSEEWKEFISRFPFMPPEEWLEIINAGNSRPVIYVTESEELLRVSSLSTYGDGYKIFIVWLPEKMNVETANKLLKVIEEPFEDTLFILVSNDAGSLMPTVRSRLQGVEFGPIPDADIISFLCRGGKSYEEAEGLARIAAGNMNSASALLQHGSELAEFTELFIAVMRACYARKMTELMQLSESFAAMGREKSLRLLDYFARMLRESFISNLHCPPLEAMRPDEKNFVARFGPFINEANVEEMAREVDRAREDITRNANQKVVWFDLLIEFTRLIRTKGIKK